jgi:hypothetical protein
VALERRLALWRRMLARNRSTPAIESASKMSGQARWRDHSTNPAVDGIRSQMF